MLSLIDNKLEKEKNMGRTDQKKEKAKRLLYYMKKWWFWSKIYLKENKFRENCSKRWSVLLWARDVINNGSEEWGHFAGPAGEV